MMTEMYKRQAIEPQPLPPVQNQAPLGWSREAVAFGKIDKILDILLE